MSRLRWGLGALVALLSLIAALRALGAYVDHRLWLGSASVLLLAVIAVAGMVSLGKARLRIERELGALDASPPRGAWIAARRARLEAVRAAGATPDLDALATATAADERGQAYLGRYFVAVTVLVGLVGTFAGLMETLRAVAPLLRDDRLSTVQSLALPLAGLDVTFGASVVGILVTLALALVQGDLVLAEERALARLEEATAHVLVPAIWPAATRPEERVAAEVAALRGEVRLALASAGEATAARVAAATRAEIEQLVAATRETLQRVAAASADGLNAARATNEAAATALERAVTATASALQAAAAASASATRDSAQAATSSLAAATETTTRTLTAGTTEAQRSLAAAAAAVQRALAETSAQAATASDAMVARAATLVSEAHTKALEASAASSAAADAQLRSAGAALAEAAAELRAGSTALGSSVATLAPELAALAREVALLAARDDDAGADQAVGEELVRLGDGLERLEQLLARERTQRERA